jgi:hypothetical protein
LIHAGEPVDVATVDLSRQFINEVLQRPGAGIAIQRRDARDRIAGNAFHRAEVLAAPIGEDGGAVRRGAAAHLRLDGKCAQDEDSKKQQAPTHRSSLPTTAVSGKCEVRLKLAGQNVTK